VAAFWDKLRSGRRPIPRKRRIALAIVLIVLLAAPLDYAFYPSMMKFQGPSPDHGENGLWIRYKWYFGEERDYAALSKRLLNEHIRYAYFHVRFVGASGNLRFRYPDQAKALLTAVGAQAPGVKRIAWIYAGNDNGGGSVVLSNKVARAKMVSEAAWLCNTCGFDGVQWDYEICADGDKDLLALLDETRKAIPAGKILSISSALWAPGHKLAWSDEYFQQVARRCDQIAVMGYDSGMWWPRAYDKLMQEQVSHVTTAAAVNPNCRVLIGIPTYGKGGPSHNPWAENIAVALHGIREGYKSPSVNRSQFAGVAIFADYTTTSEEWKTYERFWLNK